MPDTKYNTSKYKLKQNPWITNGIISSIKHRDYLFCMYKRSQLLADLKAYEKFRNHLAHLQRII